MKFYIDLIEIKTVNTGASIEGSTNLVSRTASFSYIYNPLDSNFVTYKAKVNSNVLIQNDDGVNIFSGVITCISYTTDSGLIQVQAQDLLYVLLSTTITGRFKGDLVSVIKTVLEDFEITNGITTNLTDEVNILSLGEKTPYDVIYSAVYKLYGEDFKLYLDGDSKINLLLPSASNSRGDFIIGQNILSSSFSTQDDKNFSQITAIGDDNIISGATIRVVEPESGLYGYFTVEKDRHIYTKTYTMELEIKERTFD